jgi:hypothetical protein
MCVPTGVALLSPAFTFDPARIDASACGDEFPGWIAPCQLDVRGSDNGHPLMPQGGLNQTSMPWCWRLTSPRVV